MPSNGHRLLEMDQTILIADGRAYEIDYTQED